MPEQPQPRRNRWVVAVLVILPLWLMVSAGLGLWKYSHDSKKLEIIEPSKFVTPVDEDRLADDMRKLVDVVGPRNTESESGARGLRRAASMIQGSLGLGNAGYRIELENGPMTPNGQWPIIVATLPGGDSEPVWVVAGYDTLGAGVEANSSGVVSLIAVARALAGESFNRPVKFAFLPHAYDLDGPVQDLLAQFTGMAEKADLVLVVEAMGAKGGLMASSRDAGVLARTGFEKHATIVGAEAVCLADDFDLASTLFEMGLPAARVATRRVVTPVEADETMPDPARHAASSRALGELVVSLAE